MAGGEVGLDGKLIDFGKRPEVPMRDLAIELLEFLDDVLDELGSREAVNYVHTVLAEAPAPTVSSRCSGAPATSRQSCSIWFRKPVRAWKRGAGDEDWLVVRPWYAVPPAFIERVNQLGHPHGITAEMVKFGGTKMDQPSECGSSSTASRTRSSTTGAR